MARRTVVILVSLLLMAAAGPSFIDDFQPGPREGIDFFQDWSSAKNWREGLPVYTDLRITAERYLGRRFAPGEEPAVLKNAHPPTSILLTLPFAWLDYPTATAAWNVLSLACLALGLWILVATLELPFRVWWVIPAFAVALTCNPFRHQVQMGQINGLLVALVIGMWAADRGNRPRVAGALLALAAAIKLTPALFFVFFALRRSWRVLAAAILAGVLLTIATASVIGVESYRTYFGDVLPLSERYTAMRMNASLAGFWAKWFDTGVKSHITLETIAPPLAHRPGWALVGMLLTILMVGVYWISATVSARTRRAVDLTTGASISAMLLLSPSTWDHSLLLLILPLTLVWPFVVSSRARRMGFGVAVFCLWVSPTFFWNLLQPLHVVSPVLPLIAASLQCFALVGVFLLGVRSSTTAAAAVLPSPSVANNPL